MVTVLTKPNCQQCKMTKRDLDRSGVEYVIRDLSTDADALALAKELGHLSAPIVIADGESWSGYRPDKIAALVD